MEMSPIGFIESCYKDRFGTPRQPGLVAESWSKVKLLPHVQPEDALAGIEGFSHVWLIFIFHKNTNLRFHAKVHPPRLGGESLGVFATRSPHRPNPIGLSLVRLEKKLGSELFFRGGDLIDGTPVLDIKPYLPEVESIPHALSGWTKSSRKSIKKVLFSTRAEEKLAVWSGQLKEANLKQIIIDTLSLDPRPLVYK